MSNNSNAKQSKPIFPETPYSLLLGIISIILPFIIIAWHGGWLTPGSALDFLLGVIVAGICAILGLTFGIKGLKSTRRKLAIAGIAVCAIGLLILIWGLLVWSIMTLW